MCCLRIIKRPAEPGELVVRQVVRLEARLASPQPPTRVGVLAPQSKRLDVLHQRRHCRQRPVRRPGMRSCDPIVPVAHILRTDGVNATIAEGGQYPAPHGARVGRPGRRLPAPGAVGEERRRDHPQGRDCRRCIARLGTGDDRARRLPCVLDRQRVERAERSPDDVARAPPPDDPSLAAVRSRVQSEPRHSAVPQHGLAHGRVTEGARPRIGDPDSVCHVPNASVRFGRDRRDESARFVGARPGHAGAQRQIQSWEGSEGLRSIAAQAASHCCDCALSGSRMRGRKVSSLRQRRSFFTPHAPMVPFPRAPAFA